MVVPTPDYVRFATHYRFRPDFCEAADPESKGMVKHLIGYAKRDLIVLQAPFDDLAAANDAGAAWCAEVNTVEHSEICAVPVDRLAVEQPLFRPLPSLPLELGARPVEPEGRPVVVCPVRVGPLLGAVPADRPPGHHHHHRLDDRDRRADHRRDAGRTPAGRARGEQHRRRSLRRSTTAAAEPGTEGQNPNGNGLPRPRPSFVPAPDPAAIDAVEVDLDDAEPIAVAHIHSKLSCAREEVPVDGQTLSGRWSCPRLARKNITRSVS